MRKSVTTTAITVVMLTMFPYNSDAQSIRIYMNDGSMQDMPAQETSNITPATRDVPLPNTYRGHQYVDLGLSVMWATCNVDAENPEDYGGYYAWGETKTKDYYNWNSYALCSEANRNLCHFIGYEISGTTYDVARKKWGGGWRLPTSREMDELLNNCTREWVQQNGVSGMSFTGPNGNSIFIPATGHRWKDELFLAGQLAYIWSGTLAKSDSCAYGMDIGFDGNVTWNDEDDPRMIGFTVRPVVDVNTEKIHAGYEYVDLGLSTDWAISNVGASSPEETGYFYSWGEVRTKDIYNWNSYAYYNPETYSSTFIGRDISGTAFDAARVNWGGDWRTPTAAEVKELISRCTHEWTAYNGKNGIRFTGPNGNSVFIPASGFRWDDPNGSLWYEGQFGYIWTSTVVEGKESAFGLDFGYDNSLTWDDTDDSRSVGFPVRPVKTNTTQHQSVDLGLGVEWASCNMGAERPEDYGDYYAWGETETKDIYNWSTYTYCGGSENTCIDLGGDISGTKYDAARVKWGGDWQLPSIEDMRELMMKCKCEWTTQNGVKGLRFTATNGNSIFLPACGYRWDGNLSWAGQWGYIWSGNPGSYGFNSYALDYGDDNSLKWDEDDPRAIGFAIRPVRKVISDYEQQKGFAIVKNDGTEEWFSRDDVDYILGHPGIAYDIPDDGNADPNPDVEDPNTNIPNPHLTVEDDGVDLVFRFDMTGIQDPNDPSTWLTLYGTGSMEQNTWISIDDKPKGFIVTPAEDESDTEKAKLDLVFTIDNSGSMSEEADAIARDILAWSQELEASNLDVRYGCVGYDGAITGALNLTTAASFSSYLNNGTGVYRTQHFGGSDSNELSSATEPYRTGGSSDKECGAAAIRYADELFDFRYDANRVYVNFTDEGNQPNGNMGFSVEFFKDQSNWKASQGTVHTVFSDSPNFTESPNYQKPWRISEYTGGTTLFADRYFRGVNLSSLPVTGAMQNAYIIRMANVKDVADGLPHILHITILSKDGSVRADRSFTFSVEK